MQRSWVVAGVLAGVLTSITVMAVSYLGGQLPGSRFIIPGQDQVDDADSQGECAQASQQAMDAVNNESHAQQHQHGNNRQDDERFDDLIHRFNSIPLMP